jgi:hypothetical protein
MAIDWSLKREEWWSVCLTSFIVGLDYNTVSGVNGPLVILDNVKACIWYKFNRAACKWGYHHCNSAIQIVEISPRLSWNMLVTWSKWNLLPLILIITNIYSTPSSLKLSNSLCLMAVSVLVKYLKSKERKPLFRWVMRDLYCLATCLKNSRCDYYKRFLKALQALTLRRHVLNSLATLWISLFLKICLVVCSVALESPLIRDQRFSLTII